VAPRLKVRRVMSQEDRKRPSVFMRLKTGEKFVANALFEPDPTPSDENPGYFEYMDHYDATANQYVPCAGDQCPFCRVNDNPSTRAMTVWYFPENDVNDRIKVFTMNFSTTEDISDIAEEEDGIFGKSFRVKRLSDKGEYRVRPMSEKPLTKAAAKKIMSDPNFPNLEEIVDRQLKAQWERLKAAEMLEEDDDDEDEDDEDTTPATARKGRAKVADPEEDEDVDEDEEEDEEEEDVEDEEDEDEDEEEEDDEDEDEDEDEAEAEDEEEEAEVISGTYAVVTTDEANETVTVKVGSDESEIWLSEGMELDFDEIKKGTKMKVEAVQDDDGDWVASEISVVKATRKATGGTTKARTARK
jgi:hypothetical protein